MTLTHLEVSAYWIKNLTWLQGQHTQFFSAKIPCKHDQQQQKHIVCVAPKLQNLLTTLC